MTAPDLLADDDGATDTTLDDPYRRRSPERPLDALAMDDNGVLPEAGRGFWLDEPDEQVVREAVIRLWERQDTPMKRKYAIWERNERWRGGERGLQVVRASEDEDVYFVRDGFATKPKAPNRANHLIKRVVATLTVDPLAPDVEPNSDEDRERDASALAERVLRVEGSPQQRDDAGMLRTALDQAGTYGSMFVYTFLHPTAGGYLPVRVQAHPLAQTVDDAVLDPMTGLEADPAMLRQRYVRPDGTLTDVAAEAQRAWEPKVVERLLRPHAVRFVPGVVGIGELAAEASSQVLVAEVVELREVIARYYDGERPDETVVRQLTGWKPAWKDKVVSPAVKELLKAAPRVGPDGLVGDETPVALLHMYLEAQPGHPEGAYVCISGVPDALLARSEWTFVVGEGEAQRRVAFPCPVAQCLWGMDGAHGDPYGVAGIEELGPVEEMRATAMRYVLDYVDRFGSPQAYLPIGTTIQPGQLRTPGLRKPPMYVPEGGTVFYEPLPPLSPAVQGLYDGAGREMDSLSGLEAAAQGVASGNVKSGTHAQTVIEQALVALAGLSANVQRFAIKVWTHRLLFMQAFYDAPVLLAYLGEGGDTQVKAFVGSDLVGAGDLKIKRGSGTMLPRSAKVALAREELAQAMQLGDQLAAKRYQDAVLGNTSTMLGVEDDPHRARIKRQIAEWRKRSKQQHPPPPPPVPQQVPVPITDPMGNVIGQDVQVQMVPPPDPVAQQAASLFAPNPTDALPFVASLRFLELADAVGSTAFAVADPRFQQAIVAEMERMRAAAGVMTLQEQQQAQAQQAQQQAMEAQQSADAEQAAQMAYAAEQAPDAVSWATGGQVGQNAQTPEGA